jgi:hypothetical protein
MTPGLFFQCVDLKQRDLDDFSRIKGLDLISIKVSLRGHEVAGLAIYASKQEYLPPFLSLADNLFDKLALSSLHTGVIVEILELMSEWMEFWRVDGATPLREKILGLLGEIASIESVVDLDSATFDNWEGPLSGNHDFRTELVALEVKVCGSRSGSLSHKISSQRQLEAPKDGQLFLHSLRIQLGQNFANPVSETLDRVSRLSLFSSPAGKFHFQTAIATAGISEGVPSKFGTYEILESHLFVVEGDFPRLNSDVVPPGVSDVHYSIDLSSRIPDALDLRQNVRLNLKTGELA